MSLSIKVSLEEYKSLPPNIQEHYAMNVIDNGIYDLSISGLENTAGIKSALLKERKGRLDAERAIRKLSNLSMQEIRDSINNGVPIKKLTTRGREAHSNGIEAQN